MERGGLKVLMISTDRNILTPGSAVSERMKEYAGLVDELHIVLLSDKSHNLKETSLTPKLWVYPTNSSSKWNRSRNAASLGNKIVLDRQFVRGRSLIECGLAGLKVKKKWRLPLQVQLHTDPFSANFSGFINFLRKQIGKKVIKNANSIRVVNEGLKKQLIENFGAPSEKISTLPIYIDRQKIEDSRVLFDLHTRYGWHFIILTVTRLSPEKNIGLQIQILQKVRERYPDTGLVIVGSGPEEERLKELAAKLHQDRNTAFAGWQDDLGSFYKTANVYLQTSLFEGYGLSLVEAGLHGLPIITTPVGVAEELEHGKDAYICPSGNVERFADAAIDLIENNLKRENLKINIKRTLEAKLLSKEEYMQAIKTGWEETSLKLEA